MGALRLHGLVSGAFHNCQSSKLLLFMMLPALSFLLFPLVHPDSTLVLRLWESFGRVFEGSASVFLLLNGVVVTIIASSKIEQSVARGNCHAVVKTEQRKKALSSDGGDSDFELRAANRPGFESVRLEGEMACGEGSQDNRTAIEEISYNNEDQQRRLMLVPHSNHGEDEALPKISAHRDNVDSGHGDAVESFQTSLTRSGCEGNPAPSDDEAPSAEEVWAAIVAAKSGGNFSKPSNNCSAGPEEDANKRQVGAVSSQMVDIKAESATAGCDAGFPACSTVEAPSAEEVWAAIMLEKKGEGALIKASDTIGNEGTHAVAPAAARAVEAERPPWRSSPPILSRPKKTSRPRLPVDASGHGDGAGELEDLNRRAEEFIARFNETMRLQRLESLRRRRAQRRAHRRGGHHLQRRPSKGANCQPPEIPRPSAVRAGVMVA